MSSYETQLKLLKQTIQALKESIVASDLINDHLQTIFNQGRLAGYIEALELLKLTEKATLERLETLNQPKRLRR